MAKIDEKTTKHVADLIKIHLTPSEVTEYSQDLNTAIGAVETFSELDTKDTPITSQTIGTENIMREDDVVPGLEREKALSNAGKTKNGYFVVKKVL